MSGPFAKVTIPTEVSDAGIPSALSRMAADLSRALGMGLQQVRQDLNLGSNVAMAAPSGPSMS